VRAVAVAGGGGGGPPPPPSIPPPPPSTPRPLTSPPRRCRDALERRAVNGRAPASQQRAAVQHWPLGYPLPAPMSSAFAEHPRSAAASVLRPMGAIGAPSHADIDRGRGVLPAVSSLRSASGHAGQGSHPAQQLPMAAAQLSRSPLIKQLVSQHQGQRPSQAIDGQLMVRDRVQAAPGLAHNVVRCCSMPERVCSSHSQDLHSTGSQEHVRRPVMAAQQQRQQPAPDTRPASAPAEEQPRLPLRQVLHIMLPHKPSETRMSGLRESSGSAGLLTPLYAVQVPQRKKDVRTLIQEFRQLVAKLPPTPPSSMRCNSSLPL